MGSVRPAGRATLLVAAFAVTAVACSGQVVSLGDREPRRYHFETPQIVAELATVGRTDNPTLTADLLEIYFTSDRAGANGDIWFAKRSDPHAAFGAPSPVTEVNSDSFETSAAISADGLTLWFGSDRGGGVGTTDIWMSNRTDRSAPWSSPVNVVALNTAAEDIPRPPGQHGLVMPLASKQGGAPDYRTFLAPRPTTGTPFRMPALVSELVYPDRSTVDGFLTDDGLTLFFSSSPFPTPADAGPRDAGATADGGAPSADLYVAWRQSVDGLFNVTQTLEDLNTGGDERDPWLTPDGKTLYFTSDRDGVLTIYTAAVKPR
jgi:hypothetical protein